MSFYIRHKDRKTVDILRDSSTRDADGDYSGSETTIYDNIVVSILPAKPGTILRTASGSEVVANMTMFSAPLADLQVRDIVRHGSIDYEVVNVYDFDDHIECGLLKKEV